jgi:hypothetical protein
MAALQHEVKGIDFNRLIRNTDEDKFAARSNTSNDGLKGIRAGNGREYDPGPT